MESLISCCEPLDESYCSQPRVSTGSTPTLELGAKIIEDLLRREILCRHNVEEINSIYRDIQLYEKKIDLFPKCYQLHTQYTLHLLNKIINKIEEIFSNLTVNGLISLYHLQNFKEEVLPIEQLFQSAIQNFNSKRRKIQELTLSLPCCGLENQFENDVKQLINCNGLHQINNNIREILDKKRAKLSEHKNFRQEIRDKQSDLILIRREKPNIYPNYLDDILNSGYIYLYNHLIKMKAISDRNSRRREIEIAFFSEWSHIILEARKAIIQKVEDFTPTHCSKLLFLIGNAGSGKSTTLSFLRGDQLVLDSFSYKLINDQDHLIGHPEDTSGTFLPTIERIKDWTIVDFPGFYDTNGPLISLGIEFALKFLIKKFHPRVLVLESITNIEGRFAPSARLGSNLERVLGDKENCVLGLTKYSKNPDFITLGIIEEQQKKFNLDPNSEEFKLIVQIKTLTEYAPNLLDSIAEKKQKLKTLQEKQNISTQLPETEEKIKCRKNLESIEKQILNQVGLKSLIRFDLLSDSNRVSDYFNEFDQMLPVQDCLRSFLEENDEAFLLKGLLNDLMSSVIKESEYPFIFNNKKIFLRSIKESSLTNTLLLQSHPEVGQFLHLDEMDPSIVQAYDKKIISVCIKNYTKFTLSLLDIASINKAMKLIKNNISQNIFSNFESKLSEIQVYILKSLGELPDNKAKIEDAWESARNRNRISNIKEDLLLPEWAINLLKIPIEVPTGLQDIVNFRADHTLSNTSIINIVNSAIKELEKLFDAIMQLKEIESLTILQEDIHKIFSKPISNESEKLLKQSILERIDQVRNAYGTNEWDQRVSQLSDKFKLSDFKIKSSAHQSCLTIYAYLLIEPGLHYDVNEINLYDAEKACFRICVDKQPILITQETGFNTRSKNNTNSPKELIEVTDQGLMPKLADFSQLIHENLLIKRALNAAAILKANAEEEVKGWSLDLSWLNPWRNTNDEMSSPVISNKNAHSSFCENLKNFETSHHLEIGKNIILKGLDANNQDLFIKGITGVRFEHILALAGDFYGIYNESISLIKDNEEKVEHFLKAFNSLANAEHNQIRKLIFKIEELNYAEPLLGGNPYCSSIEILDSHDEILKIKNDINKLRIENSYPFYKNAEEIYHIGHSLAITIAKEAGKNKSLEKLKHAYAVEAFACHFLIDRFAAGHIRNQRNDLEKFLINQLHFETEKAKKLALLLAAAQHEKDGFTGINVTNAVGKRWRVYEDNHFYAKKNLTNKEQVNTAVQLSVDQILIFYNMPELELQNSIQELIPFADDFNPLPLYLLEGNSLIVHSRSLPIEIKSQNDYIIHVYKAASKYLSQKYIDKFLSLDSELFSVMNKDSSLLKEDLSTEIERLTGPIWDITWLAHMQDFTKLKEIFAEMCDTLSTTYANTQEILFKIFGTESHRYTILKTMETIRNKISACQNFKLTVSEERLASEAIFNENLSLMRDFSVTGKLIISDLYKFFLFERATPPFQAKLMTTLWLRELLSYQIDALGAYMCLTNLRSTFDGFSLRSMIEELESNLLSQIKDNSECIDTELIFKSPQYIKMQIDKCKIINKCHELLKK